MKTILVALIALIAGTAIGIASTRSEFPDVPSAAAAYLKVSEQSRAAGGIEGPKVEVSNGELHDFGRMDRHGHASHAFIVRNVGDAPLQLEKGETTCKCTVSDLKENQLPPGGETQIVLEWTAKTGDREFSQSAELLTNDPARPKVRLLVKGTVIDSVRPDRRELSFNSISATEPSAARMRIYGFREQKLEVVEHEWFEADQVEFFEASFRPLAKEEVASEEDATSGVEMLVKIKSGLPLGPIAQTIRLTTNYDKQPTVEIPVVGRVAGDIGFVGAGFKSERNQLALGLIQRAAGKRVTLRAIIKGDHRDDTQLSIESIEPPGLLATLGEVSREAQLVTVPLTIEVPPGMTPGSHLGNAESKAGKIVLKTTHPEIKQIEIDVRFAVQP